MARILTLNSVLSCPRRSFNPNSQRAAQSRCAGTSGRRAMFSSRAFKVEIETQTGLETITVEDGDTILQTALDQGIELTHDCKMGVCMTCPARLVRAGPITEATEEIWKLRRKPTVSSSRVDQEFCCIFCGEKKDYSSW